MDFWNGMICVLFSTLAMSYAWGMRGTLIGGEKGAMLPGAFIGLILAWFAGGEFRNEFWIIAAAGLMGMTYGGTEPYGETIGMVLHRGKADYRPIKGYTGLAVKGSLWFSIAGGFIAIAFACMSGTIYTVADIVIFCLLIPLVQQMGYWIFNSPYNKEKGKYPRIFFSLSRREEWGSNAAVLIAMITAAVIKGDDFTLAMICAGFFSGAVGWISAMKLYELSEFPLKNGKYLFGKLRTKGLIDGWKIMEFALGAFGGFGLSLAFCINFDFIEQYKSTMAVTGRWNPIGIAEAAMPYVCGATVILICAVNIYQFVCGRKGKKINGYVCDLIERPLYNVIPMLFVLLGSLTAARVMTVFMLIFVNLIKCVFDLYEKKRFIIFWQVVAGAVCAVLFVGDILLGWGKPIWIIIAGTVPYLLAELVWSLSKTSRGGKTIKQYLRETPFLTVFLFFIAQSAALIAISLKIF